MTLSKEIKLLFPYNQANKPQGLNNSGVETYMDNPYAGMARELGQNSIDVRSNKEKPVVMHFKKIDLPIEDIPDLQDFKRITNICLKTSIDRKNDKEVSFFDKAKFMLAQPSIPVLEVSDFNTTGASNRGFEALTGEGETEKENSHSGGSFGIGKSAGFAVSDLRTVFYSTKHIDGYKLQGISLYRSHDDNVHDGQISRQAKGYWGVDFEPIVSPEKIPSWMRRRETGTSIFALGMRPSKVAKVDGGWASETLTVLAINFFAAIHKGVVQFNLEKGDETLCLDENTIKGHIEGNVLSKIAEEIALSNQLERSRALFKCLNAPEPSVHVKEISVPDVGKFKIRLLLEDSLGYKIGILRNGIYITNTLEHFGHKFSKFPMYREFALIIEPADEKTSECMKRLENPSHDALTPTRIVDEEERRVIENGYKKLGHQVREFIKSHAKSKIADEQDLDEMNEFFNSDAEMSDEDGDEQSIKEIRITEMKVSNELPKNPKKQKAKASTSTSGKFENGENQANFGEASGSGGDGKGAEEGNSENEAPVFRPALIRDPRIVRGNFGPTSRTINFTPDSTGTLKISVIAEGINESVNLPVAVPGTDKFQSCIIVNGSKGNRMSVNLDLTDDYKGAVSVSCEVSSPTGGKK